MLSRWSCRPFCFATYAEMPMKMRELSSPEKSRVHATNHNNTLAVVKLFAPHPQLFGQGWERECVLVNIPNLEPEACHGTNTPTG